jgi:hypothetical protein
MLLAGDADPGGLVVLESANVGDRVMLLAGDADPGAIGTSLALDEGTPLVLEGIVDGTMLEAEGISDARGAGTTDGLGAEGTIDGP